MGYEVLDVGPPGPPPGGSGPDAQLAGSGGGVPGSPHPAAEPEVVDLDELPDPVPPPDPSPPSRLAGPTAVRVRTAVVLAVVLAAGLVTGATWAGTVDRRERTAERQATLAVTALSDSWSRVRWIRRPVVDVVVRVVNTGPLPVDVVGSSFGDPPRPGGPYVRSLGAGLRVGPGDELAVSMLQRLDCSSAVALTLELPIRTADGVVHQVAVRRGGPERLLPRQVCLEGTEDLGVTGTVEGTLRHPMVQLRNPASRPVTILEDPLVPLAQARPVIIRTTPRLPLSIAAGGTRWLTLEVRASGCTNLVEAQAAAHLGLIALSNVPGSGQGSSLDTQRQPVDVDLSAVVGAAVQRACD
jgi:hypothetical protein